jgi:hypothetical protein
MSLAKPLVWIFLCSMVPMVTKLFTAVNSFKIKLIKMNEVHLN